MRSWVFSPSLSTRQGRRAGPYIQQLTVNIHRLSCCSSWRLYTKDTLQRKLFFGLPCELKEYVLNDSKKTHIFTCMCVARPMYISILRPIYGHIHAKIGFQTGPPHKQNYVRPGRLPTSRITTREAELRPGTLCIHNQNYDQGVGWRAGGITTREPVMRLASGSLL